MLKRYFILLVLFWITSCKNEEVQHKASNELAFLELEYEKNPSDSIFNQLIHGYGSNISATNNKFEKEKLIIKAIQICRLPEKGEVKALFSVELLKLNPYHPYIPSIMWNLGERLLSENKTEAASIIFKGYCHKFIGNDECREAEKFIISDQSDIHGYIKGLAGLLYIKTNQQDIDLKNAQIYLDVCESFALAFPEDILAPEYLFQSAEINRALKNYENMIRIYDWIYNYFPKYDKAPLTLFLKGFTIDSELKLPQEAKKNYELFLENHPNDSLSNDVKFLLKNIGRSNENILKQLNPSCK